MVGKSIEYERPLVKEIRNTEIFDIDKIYANREASLGYCICPCRCY
jgi:hypothetical protein